MTKEEIFILIEKVNKNCPEDQGIFTQPTYIPIHIKEPVIYSRYKCSEWSGGNCWGDVARYYEVDDAPDFVVLDLVLAELFPNMLYTDMTRIRSLIHTNEETEYEYYGNSTEYKVEYIILSELIDLIFLLKD